MPTSASARVTADASRESWRHPPAGELRGRDVHVWRIRLDRAPVAQLRPLLSADEEERARRFHRDSDRRHYIAAHGMLRLILSSYGGGPPGELPFVVGVEGKPALRGKAHKAPIQFNLSHSGDLALVAVSREAEVGVDVERWNADMGHLEVAEYCFSRAEREALRSLEGVKDDVVRGFFAAWSRKEAYLKATGQGVVKGLDHFDVTLVPGESARLIVDHRDPSATHRWLMTSLSVGPEYSAALVVEAPVGEIQLFDAVSEEGS